MSEIWMFSFVATHVKAWCRTDTASPPLAKLATALTGNHLLNRLADSLSPYLLQHKDNPVDWFPWGEEALERSRQTDRPIFLSVGYAACHWCHVMEHESFENESIAAYLNENFVSIKVDREERPDIDQIYMNAVQVDDGPRRLADECLSESRSEAVLCRDLLAADAEIRHARFRTGSWMRWSMPGRIDATKSRNTRAKSRWRSSSWRPERPGSSSEMPDDTVIATATDHLLRVLDRNDGGFGGAPKFPHATDLDLLLRRGSTNDEPELIEAAELTLDRMAAGGIRDHIGGGFARYSVDAKWLVPHFEKMLYDNALLGEVYVRAFQVTGNERHADGRARDLRLPVPRHDRSGGRLSLQRGCRQRRRRRKVLRLDAERGG